VALEAALARFASAPGAVASEIRRIAHQLRGSGSSYGFPAISQLAGELEDAPAERVADAAAVLIAHLQGLTVTSARREHRILVVEDDPMMVRLVRHALAASDRTLEFVESARKSEESVAARRPDLILLDLILPDEDGRRLLATWRVDPKFEGVPIIVFSAEVGPLVEAECLGLGAAGFIRKPVEAKALADVVAARLGAAEPPLVVRSPSRQATGSGEAGNTAAETSGRVLVADDDPLLAAMVRHRLEQAGFVVDYARDGAQAMEFVEAALPRVAVLDVKMPVMDGFEVLARIRADSRTRRVPVLVLTALGGEPDLIRAFQLGADDYLLKPFSPSELLARVKRLAART